MYISRKALIFGAAFIGSYSCYSLLTSFLLPLHQVFSSHSLFLEWFMILLFSQTIQFLFLCHKIYIYFFLMIHSALLKHPWKVLGVGGLEKFETHNGRLLKISRSLLETKISINRNISWFPQGRVQDETCFHYQSVFNDRNCCIREMRSTRVWQGLFISKKIRIK